MKTDIIKIEIKEQIEKNESKDMYHLLIDPINQCSDSIDKAVRQVSKFDNNIKKTEEILSNWLVQNYEMFQTEIAALIAQIKQSGTILYIEFDLTASGIQNFRKALQEAEKEAEILAQTIGQILGFGNNQDNIGKNTNETGGLLEQADTALSLSSNIIGIVSALNDPDNPFVKLLEEGKTSTALKPIGKAFVFYDSVRQVSDAFGDIERADKIKDPIEADIVKTNAVGKMAASTVFPSVGAFIGNLIAPGIGSWIGAGIGDLVSNLFGSILDLDEKRYKKIRLEMEQAKYSTKELQDALADTNITAEEFAKLFEKAVGENIQQHFQGVILSLEEIQKVAQKIIFGDDLKEFQRFTVISEEVQQSLMNLEGSADQIEQWKWKMDVGIKLEPEEQTTMLNDINAFMKDALSYFDNTFYETTAAVRLLVKDEADAKEILDPINETFLNMREELVQNIKELQDYINNTEKIDYSTLMNKVGKVQEKTKILSDTQSDTDWDIIQKKYEGKIVSLETYNQMHNEYSQLMQIKAESLDESLEHAMWALNMGNETGSVGNEQYLSAIAQLRSDYKNKINEINSKARNEQFTSFVRSYKNELNSFLPGKSEDDLKEYLEKMAAHVQAKIDIKDWDNNTLFRYMGLELLQSKDFPDNEAWKKEIWKNMQLAGNYASKDEINILLKETVQKVLSSGETEKGIDVERALELVGISELKRDDRTAFTDIFQKILSLYVEDHSSDIIDALQKTNLDFPGEKTALAGPAGLALPFFDVSEYFFSESFIAQRQTIQKALDNLFSPGFTIKANAAIKMNYKLGFGKETFPKADLPELNIMLQQYSQLPVYMGGDSPIRQLAEFQANGNIISSPTLSIIGEAGPEAIIPLSASRRSRGISLWEKAGEMLGMVSSRDYNSITYSSDGLHSSASGVNVQIDVQLAPSFAITNDNNNEEGVVSAIHSNLSSMAEELSGQIAVQLQSVFSNMPLQKA